MEPWKFWTDMDTETLPNEGRPYLQIAVNRDGNVVIHGSLNDRAVCLQLISIARKAIKSNMQDKISSGIVKP